MANKSNIRSIRFSDDLAELIDRQAGANFTEKFTALVTRCVWELPQKEAQLKLIDKQIAAQRAELDRLRNRYFAASDSLNKINASITQLANYVK